MTRIFDIDFNSYDKDAGTGYGKVAHQLSSALDKEINVFEKSKNVLNFCMPKDYIFKDLTIGYTPWESTKVKDGWIDQMLKCDDIWATCEWNANLFCDLTGRQAFILPHGVDPAFTPFRRHYDSDEPFTFLHIGAPAERKGDDILFNIWYRHFRKREDVRLVFKVGDGISARIRDKSGSIIASPYDIPNITVKSGKYSTAEMVLEMMRAHCMVYPSRGEGWGLIPFEALATGLPTILPLSGMGDFSIYGFNIYNSTWVESSNQIIHPGEWMEHDEDEIIETMEAVIAKYDEIAKRFYQRAKWIHDDYNWDAIAQKAIDRIQFIADMK